MTLNCTLLAGAVAAFCLGVTNIGVPGLGVQAAHAQGADFSRKTITIYIGNTAGGTYDLMGRLVARHLGRFLPGNPTVVPENMPGAGTLRAANHIFNVAPKDGTALGIVSETIAVEQALHNPAVQFDARKLTWIGRVAASNAVHIIWRDFQGAVDRGRQALRGDDRRHRNRQSRRDGADAAQCGHRHEVQDHQGLPGRQRGACSPWSAARSRVRSSTGRP